MNMDTYTIHEKLDAEIAEALSGLSVLYEEKLIVMHPDTREKLIDELQKLMGYDFPIHNRSKTMYYRGVKVARSEDIEPDKFWIVVAGR